MTAQSKTGKQMKVGTYYQSAKKYNKLLSKAKNIINFFLKLVQKSLTQMFCSVER